MKILIIDDEIKLFEYIIKTLNKNYTLDIAETGKIGLYRAKYNKYEAIVLDISLPDYNGIDLCKDIRKLNNFTPIIMLTADSSTENKVKSLNFGADDYLTKPFEIDELDARIKSIIRRNQYHPRPKTITINNFVLNQENQAVYYKNQDIHLSKKEFEIFEILFRNVNQTITRKNIANSVWITEANISSNTIDVHIARIRKKLSEISDEIMIKSINKFGYSLIQKKRPS